MLSAAARKQRRCSEDAPCRHYDPCVACQAEAVLTPLDLYAIDFYRKVSDQYINQTPMGAKEPIVTARVEAWEAVLRLNEYAEEDWRWLLETGMLLHRLIHKMERIDWMAETGKRYRDITTEDVTDGSTL